jgi:hypothetical protein
MQSNLRSRHDVRAHCVFNVQLVWIRVYCTVEIMAKRMVQVV